MKTSVLLASASLALLAGCASNVNTVERAQPLGTPNYIADKRVITDNTLAGTLRVLAINQATVSGNLLKIQATVENLKNSAKTVSYKFEWFDKDGMAIDSPNESWKALRIQGRETTTLTTVAINPRAVDFVLKLQEPK